MDDPRKDSKPRLVPSSSTSDLKQKIAPRRESNENEEDITNNHISFYSSSSSKLQNPKKASTPKHFMSPTISAASKVSTPRKKILMERNDSFSETLNLVTKTPISFSQSLKTPEPQNLQSKNPNSLPLCSDSVISSQITHISSKNTDSEKPDYDPKTNFLSPRPKFLRYNPNRRVEILRRREIELEQEESDDVSLSSESGLSISSTNEDTYKGFESEVEIDEEDEEMEENGRGNYLYEVMKFLLLLGIVGFSTFYISVVMNASAPNPILQSTIKQGFKMFELEKSLVLWNVSSSSINSGLGMKEEEASIRKEVELDDIIIGMTPISVESGDHTGLIAKNNQVAEEENEVEISSELVNNTPGLNGIVEDEQELKTEGIVEQENVEYVGSFGASELNEDVVENTIETNDENAEVIGESEASVLASVEEIAQAIKPVSNEDAAEEVEASKDVSYEDVDEDYEASKPDSNDDVAEEYEASKAASYDDVNEDYEASKHVSNEGVVEECEATKPVELGIGVSVVAVILLASSIITFLRLRRPKEATTEAAPTTAPTMGPPTEPILTEVQDEAESRKDEDVEGRIEKAAESYINSLWEDLHRSREAPAVQFLSEFTVEESGSVLKSKAVDGGEANKFSVSMSEKKKSRGRSGASSILQEEQTSISEFSYDANSPSTGKFTTQDKNTRRVVEDITTPLRRSSRVRTKSVTSP